MTLTITTTRAEHAAAAAFNDAHPIGTPVRYWKGVREGDGRTARTRTAAQLLGGHTAVVWLDGVSGCIALTHIQPVSADELIPDQPDGLSEHYEDDADLPDVDRAAARIWDFIGAWGDGLIDTAGGRPLYARDLEAVCRAVRAAAPADITAVRPVADAPPGRAVTTVHLPAHNVTA